MQSNSSLQQPKILFESFIHAKNNICDLDLKIRYKSKAAAYQKWGPINNQMRYICFDVTKLYSEIGITNTNVFFR